MLHHTTSNGASKRSHRKATPEEIAAAADPDALIGGHVVEALTSLKLRTIKAMIRAQQFPPARTLNQRVHRWRAGDVRDWLKKQGEQGTPPAPPSKPPLLG